MKDLIKVLFLDKTEGFVLSEKEKKYGTEYSTNYIDQYGDKSSGNYFSSLNDSIVDLFVRSLKNLPVKLQKSVMDNLKKLYDNDNKIGLSYIKLNSSNSSKGWYGNIIIVKDNDTDEIIEVFYNQGTGINRGFKEKYGDVRPLEIDVKESILNSYLKDENLNIIY